jgi:hypothetical protein
MELVTTTQSSWPGLTRPPIAAASATAKESLRRADARLMVGRLEGGHDDQEEISCVTIP